MGAHSYDPFGMMMPHPENTQAGGHSFGFQGELADDELHGNQNSYAFKARIHDPRIGRFMSVDPKFKEYPHNSPYAFSENRVLDGLELEGKEWIRDDYKWSFSNEHGITVGGVNLEGPGGYGGVFGEGDFAGNSSLRGEEGLKNYSEGLEGGGTALLATPVAPIGEAMIGGSMLINTGLDFKNKSTGQALENTVKRGATYGGGQVLSRSLKTGDELLDRGSSFASNQLAGNVQDEILEKGNGGNTLASESGTGTGSETEGTNQAGTHKIQEGDTYYSLAKEREGVSVDDIRGANSDKDERDLQPGETLTIPEDQKEEQNNNQGGGG